MNWRVSTTLLLASVIFREVSMIIRLLLISSVFFSLAAQAEKYNLVSIVGLYEQQVGQIVLPEVYKKLAIDITITAMPGNRAMLEAVSGRKDGEIMRIWSYGIEHPDMLRVPTPYYELETMAFFKEGDDIYVKSAEDLANYSVLKVRGVKHTNNITAGLEHVYDYDDTETMLRALSSHQNKVALTHTVDGIFSIKKFDLKGIQRISKPLAIFPLYHYVHKNNAHLVQRLDQVLVAMKESGELNKLIALAEKKVLENNGI